MASPYLKLALLFATCLSCASLLEPWHQNWGGGRNKTANILDMLIGDSRRMFANHFFAKADAYFHSGYYPTIFDSKNREEESHMQAGHEAEAAEEHHVHDENCKHEEVEEHHVHDENCKHEEKTEGGFLGPPKDWIDRFSRSFFPTHHSHLENGGERELLPWLRLSAQLDPQQVETYIVSSYWLRRVLNKPDEAEAFLRDGLRANPDSYEIYFELGRVYDENRKLPEMARNLYEVALRKWTAQFSKTEANAKAILIYDGILVRLAKLEEAQGNLKQTIHYLELLKEKSPLPEHIQKQIDEHRVKLDANKK